MGNEDLHIHPQQEDDDSTKRGISRRHFIKNVSLAGAGYTVMPFLAGATPQADEADQESGSLAAISYLHIELNINGERKALQIDPRSSLLDVLREQLALTGTKKGCDHGQCGACTVLVNNRRVNSCLLFAAACRDMNVTTIEGLANGDELHPMQQAFIKHDAFQCGYCTPGQICSAVGLMHEGHARTDADISELMSGNICRCGAYQNINDAIRAVYKA